MGSSPTRQRAVPEAVPSLQCSRAECGGRVFIDSYRRVICVLGAA